MILSHPKKHEDIHDKEKQALQCKYCSHKPEIKCPAFGRQKCNFC